MKKIVLKKIVGIFATEELAINAIEDLKTQGVRDNEISVVTEDEETYQAIKNRTGVDIEEVPHVPSETVTSAATGGTLGGLGGLLLGLGALAIPGVGPIVVAGPIASALVGVLAGGAIGGLAGALHDYGIPKDEAHDYERRIHHGDIMVLVEDNDDEERRKTIHENFKNKDSYNKHTYTPSGTLTENSHPKISSTGNTNHIRDSYQEQNLPSGKTAEYQDNRNTYGSPTPPEVSRDSITSSSTHQDEIKEAKVSPENTEHKMDSKPQTGNTNLIRDSYQTKDQPISSDYDDSRNIYGGEPEPEHTFNPETNPAEK